MKPVSKTDLDALDSLTDEDIRQAILNDPDAAPELDEEMLAQFRPAEEMLPHIVAQYRARRGPQRKPKKAPAPVQKPGFSEETRFLKR
ncbi:MAG TPA: hypothetical protein PK205_11095 [Promineifilum sp.]|nr:hypothetical protein [Promineifilum sp.]